MKRAAILGGLGALIVFAAGLALNRERLYLSWLGAKLEKRSIAEQQTLLEPFLHVFTPEGVAAPYPVVIQFHGCAGYRNDFMAQWAKVANDAGFLVVAVDSAGPRGIDPETALSSVCTGKMLVGQERAGDVAAAIALVAGRADVDPSRIVVAGWSHGAWSVMDEIALASAGHAPPSIDGAAAPVDLAGVALFYPYCGEGAWSRLKRWRTSAQTIAFVAGEDTIVDGPQCKTLFERIAAEGSLIDVVYYDKADHVFDDATLIGGDYEYFYDAAAHKDAAARYGAFLRSLRDRP